VLPPDLARTLTPFVPRAALTPEYLDAIRHALGAYKGQAGASGASVAETLELLMRAARGGRKQRRALHTLANERAGVDDETHRILRPLAAAVLGGKTEALPDLEHLAEARIHALEGLRFDTRSEALRLLCAVINLLFHGAHGRTPDAAMTTLDRLARRTFALELFAAGEIETPDFDQHPERLDDLLNADLVSLHGCNE